ncbi:hypothetical protein A3Q56_07157 [Intoshia linei]|uniref:Amino acid permease/ SLC12A domain-containing protein n=1 Tax=Intoshia linei TaxID=1819745 RepID=A0A177AV63_9BILA|nr:hypothetical protein A3Q56_07157 [Intoshia linei]
MDTKLVNDIDSNNKKLGFIGGSAMIIGIIVGSGIFVSPNGITKNAGSISFLSFACGQWGLWSVMTLKCFPCSRWRNFLIEVDAAVNSLSVVDSHDDSFPMRLHSLVIKKVEFGLSILVWVLTGMISILGALGFAELSILMPYSAGDIYYAKEVFGDAFGFIQLWVIHH